MIVNTKIRDMFIEITKEHIKYLNTTNSDRKYLKRMLKVFKNDLTEEEQEFLLAYILDNMHYKNIITDPETIIQIHNIKLRTVTYIFLLSVLFILITAILFKTNDGLNSLIDIFVNVFKVLTF